MIWNKKIDKLADLNLKGFQGYLWASDKNKPEKTTDLTKFIENQNPFIIEAAFYNQEEEKSISIKHFSGNYMINSFDLKLLTPNIEIKKIEFLANKNIGKKLKYKEIWIPEKEENCQGFEVLQKKAVVFIGIEEEEN